MRPTPIPSTQDNISHGCAGLLLAAGAGRRFLDSRPPAATVRHKLLAPLPDGRPVALASASALRAIVPQVLAVVAAAPVALHALLQEAGCEITVAAQAREGMGSSLAHGARLLAGRRPSSWHHVLVALADMPWIQGQTLQDLACVAAPAPIVAPRFQGRRGHPVRMAVSLLDELAQCAGDEGARRLLARHPVHLVDVDDPGVLADVDLWDDLYPG